MFHTRLRRFSPVTIPITKRDPNPTPRLHSTTIPIPHRSLPDARGQDQDFIAVAHSHLVHADWPKLATLASTLTPFRFKHILLKIHSDPVLSFEFFNWALHHSPSSLTLDTHAMIFHVLAKFNKFRTAEQFVRTRLIPKALNSCVELFDELLHSYRMCDSSPASFDVLFKAYAHMKKFRDATETFRRMRDYGFLPTVESCNAYISSLLSLGRADIAVAFYREMGRCRISPNVYTLNMVMRALCSSGKLEKALDVFGRMESMGISPTVSSFNTLIAGYCTNGLMSAALKLKGAMGNRGLEPSVITYNTLIHGFCKEGRMHEANKIFNEMKALEVKPNTVTYNTLINGYSRINSSEMGLRLHEEMMKNGLEADILTYNSLILGLCNEGKTRKAAFLVKELEGKNLVPNASTYFALISGQCKRENSERAFQIYKAMKKSGCHLNSDTFNLLMSAFRKNRDYDGVVEVVKEMREGWIAPEKSLLAELLEELGKSGKNHFVKKLQSEVYGSRLTHEGFLDSGDKTNVMDTGNQ